MDGGEIGQGGGVLSGLVAALILYSRDTGLGVTYG
jgi:hypothetical protein